MQHYVIKFVSDFLRVLRFPPPIKMLLIQLPYDHDGSCMKYKYKYQDNWYIKHWSPQADINIL